MNNLSFNDSVNMFHQYMLTNYKQYKDYLVNEDYFLNVQTLTFPILTLICLYTFGYNIYKYKSKMYYDNKYSEHLKEKLINFVIKQVTNNSSNADFFVKKYKIKSYSDVYKIYDRFVENYNDKTMYCKTRQTRSGRTY